MIGIAEMSGVLGFSQTKVRKMAMAGEIPATKFGSQWVAPRNKFYRELGLDLPDEETTSTQNVSLYHVSENNGMISREP